jgi:hypothetical protein
MLGGARERPDNSQRLVPVRHQDVVSVGKFSLGQERYYLEQAEDRVDVAESLAGAEDYYVGGSEDCGRWCGSAAPELGLTGAVDADELRVRPVGVVGRRALARLAPAGAWLQPNGGTSSPSACRP